MTIRTDQNMSINVTNTISANTDSGEHHVDNSYQNRNDTGSTIIILDTACNSTTPTVINARTTDSCQSVGSCGSSGCPAGEERHILAERFKTKMCRSYELYGSCPYEGRCMFAHGEQNLRTAKMNLRDGLFTEDAIKAYQRAVRLAARSETNSAADLSMNNEYQYGAPSVTFPEMQRFFNNTAAVAVAAATSEAVHHITKQYELRKECCCCKTPNNNNCNEEEGAYNGHYNNYNSDNIPNNQYMNKHINTNNNIGNYDYYSNKSRFIDHPSRTTSNNMLACLSPDTAIFNRPRLCRTEGGHSSTPAIYRYDPYTSEYSVVAFDAFAINNKNHFAFLDASPTPADLSLRAQY